VLAIDLTFSLSFSSRCLSQPLSLIHMRMPQQRAISRSIGQAPPPSSTTPKRVPFNFGVSPGQLAHVLGVEDAPS
jgi:hypothetical protein